MDRLHSPKSVAVFSATLFAACFILYGNTIGHRYSIDDETVTRGHHLTARGIAALPEIFSTPHLDFAGQVFDYRPVTLATFAVEHEIFGENPHLGHLLNVALYATAVVVLFQLLRSTLGAAATPFVFVVMLLFAAHPMHTEVVASLKSRDEILVLLLGSLSALLFLRTFERGRVLDAAGATVAFLLALMSKLSAAPFVVLVPLLLAYRYPARVRQALAVGALLVAMVLIYRAIVLAFVPALVPVPTFVENPLVAGTDWSLRIGTSLATLLFYLQKLIVPYPLHFYYGYDVFPVVGLLSPAALASIAVHACLIGYLVAHRRSPNPAVVGIVWYLAAIAPYANLLALVKGIVAERSAFLASAGFALAAVYALFRLAGLDLAGRGLAGPRRATAAVVAAALLLAYTGATCARNRDWKDSFTLYEADIGRLERSVMANQIYSRQLRREVAAAASAVERARMLHRAIALSEQAIRVLPSYAGAYAHMGAIYLYDLDQPERALPYLEKASEMAPEYVQAHYDALYGNVVLGRFDDALAAGRRLLRADPDHLLGLFYVSKLEFERGEVERALQTNARLAALAPERDLAWLNYGYFSYRRSEPERAIEYFEKALAIAPNNPPVIDDLVGILKEQGEIEKARRYEDMAAKLRRPVGERDRS